MGFVPVKLIKSIPFMGFMSRIKLSITVREEIIERLERDRGLIPLSRYVDTLLGIVYGLDPPEILPVMPPYMEWCLRELGKMKK